MNRPKRTRPWWLWVLGAILVVLVLSAIAGRDDERSPSPRPPAREVAVRAGSQTTAAPSATTTVVASTTAAHTDHAAARARATAHRERLRLQTARRDARRAAARAAKRAATKLAAAPPSTSSCDPSYSGACLNPDSADYDCEGGSGNGPDYTGTVQVVGDDHFDLDRDGDGTGCDG
jgi:hypothetical protein